MQEVLWIMRCEWIERCWQIVCSIQGSANLLLDLLVPMHSTQYNVPCFGWEHIRFHESKRVQILQMSNHHTDAFPRKNFDFWKLHLQGMDDFVKNHQTFNISQSSFTWLAFHWQKRTAPRWDALICQPAWTWRQRKLQSLQPTSRTPRNNDVNGILHIYIYIFGLG